MNHHALATRTPAARLREARRQLLERGEPGSGLIEPGLQRSWQRSRQFGLSLAHRQRDAAYRAPSRCVRL